MPDITPIVSGFNLDQTTQHIADQFEVEVNSSEPFRTQDQTELATIRHGLLDATGSPTLVEHITGGKVDEFELHASKDRLTGVLRGRDAASYAVDSTRYVTYIVGGRDWRLDFPQKPLPKQLAPIPGVTEVLFKPGTWAASGIARDLLLQVGLGLAWQAPDYILREDFAVNGTVESAIQQLAAPFSQFEPSKCDIWVEGKTMIVRARPGLTTSTANTASPANTFSALDARISDLMVRSRFLDYIRVVRLTGATRTGTLTFEEEVRTEDEIDDADGNMITLVVETVTYRRPDNAQLRVVKETYQDGDFASPNEVSTTVNDWDFLQFDGNGRIVNTPQEHSSVTETTRLDPDTGARVPAHRTTIKYTYDTDGFMTVQDTVEEDYNTDTNAYENSSRESKTYRRNGPQRVQVSATTFSPGDSGGWEPGQIRKTTGNGDPPGGPGHKVEAPQLPPLYRVGLIDNVPGAKDFTYDNKNLLQAHLEIIFKQAKDSSGATESEINFTATGLPWIRRGTIIKLTGWLAEDGVTPIDLGPALVFETRTEFRAGGPGGEPTYLTHVKAVWWEKL